MTAVPAGQPPWEAWEAEVLSHKGRTWAHTLGRYGKALLADRLALAAAVVLSLVLLISLGAPLLSPYHPGKGSLMDSMQPMGSEGHLLGTDSLGRDVATRLMYGARVSLRVGAVVVAAAGLVGTILGLLAGYYGRWVDQVIMRLLDIQFAFPGTLVALAFVLVLGAGERNVVIALAFNGWMVHARLVRSLVMSMRDGPLVEAARALGLSAGRTIFRHILPNVLSPMINLYVLEVARIILAESVLSFLGFGIQPPNASWGLMIADGKEYVSTDPWLVIIPGLAIGVTVLALNILANWFITVADPVMRKAVEASRGRKAVRA